MAKHSPAQTAQAQTVTIPRELACKLADSLLALDYFASHMQTMAEAAEMLVGSHPGKAVRLLHAMGQQAEQALEANGIGLSAKLCRIMDGGTAAKEAQQ